METCGFCLGRGYYFGPAYDREGRAQEPPRRVCEYCDGSGYCDRGDELLAAREPVKLPDHAADLKRAGNPSWS